MTTTETSKTPKITAANINNYILIWLAPMLIGIVAFFLFGVVRDIESIQQTQILLLQQQGILKQDISHIKEKVDENHDDIRDLRNIINNQ